jgi:hypothetical protein
MGSMAIEAIAEYHNDVDRSLRQYFSNVSPSFSTRFLGFRHDEIQTELAARLEETDQRSACFVLTTLEGAFRIDYECRCQRRMKDDLSRSFRALYKRQDTRVSLDKEIFEAWRKTSPGLGRLIGELRGAFRFRHWLAHGRYRLPKLGRKYDFNFVYALADDVLSAFPFQKFEVP